MANDDARRALFQDICDATNKLIALDEPDMTAVALVLQRALIDLPGVRSPGEYLLRVAASCQCIASGADPDAPAPPAPPVPGAMVH